MEYGDDKSASCRLRLKTTSILALAMSDGRIPLHSKGPSSRIKAPEDTKFMTIHWTCTSLTEAAAIRAVGKSTALISTHNESYADLLYIHHDLFCRFSNEELRGWRGGHRWDDDDTLICYELRRNLNASISHITVKI
jgi:hypothetical protein